MKLKPELLQKELRKRAAEAKKAATFPTFSLETFCFPEQLAFIKDPARFKTGVCSRRSGKTVGCAADLHNTTETLQGDVAYITLSRVSAKRIIWKDLIAINKKYNLRGKVDLSELTITKPNGNVIYVGGAKDASEAEKYRGMKFRKIYLDEPQSFRAYIKDMIDDILEPTLTDYYGSLSLIGTPGPIPAGYFYETAHNPSWSHHKWTMMQNPHIKLMSGKEPLEIISELAARRGLTINSPSIQREYFGQWVKDVDSLVYQFRPDLNVAETLPQAHRLTYIFGIDIGWRDSDAIAVLGYDKDSTNVYLVEEYVQSKNDITSLVQAIEKLREKYSPVKMVMDAGALGKKIQEEIRARHGIPVEAADKVRKLEFIALLNDDMRTGKFKAVAGTRFAEDAMLVQWNYDDPVKPKISDIYHTDIGDAVLYAWRECKHYFWQPEVKKPARDSTEYMRLLEEKEAEAMEAKNDSVNELTDVESWDDLGVTDYDSFSDDF